jgi:GMP synthase (glutamine-hydrolysing)
VSSTRVLVVEHEADTTAAWLGEGLSEAGVELVASRPYAGDELPADLDGYDGVLVLGGSMDSWDDVGTPWLPATRELVGRAEDGGVPTLGVCLGHQLAASALGGEVGRNPAGETLAVLPVAWTEAARTDPLLGGVVGTDLAVHWNRDVVLTLPAQAEVLARSPDGTVQAARLGRNVWGVQFHPEAGADLIGRWLAIEGVASTSSRTQRYLADIRKHEPSLADGCRRLAQSFASLTRRRGRGAP